MPDAFELSASLTLDAEEFEAGIARAQQALKGLERGVASAASALTALQSTAGGVWSSITAAISRAIQKTNEFLSIRGQQSLSLSISAPGVSSAEQVQAASSGGGGSSGGTSLAQTIATAIGRVAVQMDGQTVGRLVSSTVSREIGRLAQSRRYTA